VPLVSGCRTDIGHRNVGDEESPEDRSPLRGWGVASTTEFGVVNHAAAGLLSTDIRV